jgi:hypothetical protein
MGANTEVAIEPKMSEGDEYEFKSIEDAMSYIRVLAKPIHNELPPLSLYKPKPYCV